MSYKTIQDAVDFYIEYIDRISKSMAVPPKLEVLSYSQGNLPTGDCWLRVVERKNFKTNNVFAIRYSISNVAKGTLGPVTLEEYMTLSGELDTALDEYRRKNFKRISRQQRHVDDDTKYRNTRQTRHKV